MTFGDVVKAMLDNKNNRLFPVHSSIIGVRRGNGKKKPSTITIAIPDDYIDMFFNASSTTAPMSQQAEAFMVCLDRESVLKMIAEGSNQE